MSEADLLELLDEFMWFYRGLPIESQEVRDVEVFGEVTPPRPDRIGERWRQLHVAGETQTGYTSWSTDRSIAEEAAASMGDEEGLSGLIQIIKVRIDSLSADRIHVGREDESEFLIAGRIEDVTFSDAEDGDD